MSEERVTVWHDESERLEVWGTLDPPDACMCRECVLGPADPTPADLSGGRA